MTFTNTGIFSPVARGRRRRARLPALGFLAGLVAAVLAVRELPPAPVFSPQLGRATYFQSYEASYFATVRAYEAPIAEILSKGLIPVVVFGDSSIRGTGAVGDEVWTRVLEHRLQAVEPRVRIVNYAQNAGDLVAPFLFHHLQRKFPDAYYIIQWHFPSEAASRHPFHFWLTSEIALRDGNRNPAVKRSYVVMPAKLDELLSTGLKEEHYSFMLAGLNIATNYLDAGNWVRYLFLGRPYFSADRKVKVQPLREVGESDVTVRAFTPPDADTTKTMSEIFLSHIAEREVYLQRPLAKRSAYFAEMFPSFQRSHLLLLSLDFNPYYAPRNNEEKVKTWAASWAQLRMDMAQIPDLRWVSLTASHGELQIDDFLDLGHLTPQGQRRLADTVAGNLLAPGGWFAPAVETKK